MSESVRLFSYSRLLGGKRGMTAAALQSTLEISKSTLTRDITKLRDQMGVDVRFDPDRGGYYIDPDSKSSELPGLWFDDNELAALLTLQHLLREVAPELLGPKLEPLRKRFTQLINQRKLPTTDFEKRIKVLHAGKRKLLPQSFEQVARATITRKRMMVKHCNRQNASVVAREISPQRVVQYRDNWYVDAWCHLRDDVRSFSIDAFEAIEILDTPTKEVADKTIDQLLSASYGIFSGNPKAWAKLKFTPERSRWVMHEQWHPNQESNTEADGSYVLSIPYSDDREILGDIMRFGADVQVLEPADLRAKLQKSFLNAAARYV